MTISEYISEKLRRFGDISQAELLDMSLSGGFNLDDEYSSENAQSVGVATTNLVGELILQGKQSSINESGFSISWNYDGLSKYYLLLCKKYGLTPDADIVGKPRVYIKSW